MTKNTLRIAPAGFQGWQITFSSDQHVIVTNERPDELCEPCGEVGTHYDLELLTGQVTHSICSPCLSFMYVYDTEVEWFAPVR